MYLQNSSQSINGQSFVTSYNFKELVGLSSITDENSQVSAFHYDDMNRLRTVIDESDDINKRYTYNYRIDPELIVDEEEIIFAANSESKSFNIYTEGDWIIDDRFVDILDLTISSLSGSDNANITVTSLDNNIDGIIDGVLIIESNGEERKIRIRQLGI